jgi:hypothetical protein
MGVDDAGIDLFCNFGEVAEMASDAQLAKRPIEQAPWGGSILQTVDIRQIEIRLIRRSFAHDVRLNPRRQKPRLVEHPGLGPGKPDRRGVDDCDPFALSH